MKIIIDIGHPAHVHLFRNFVAQMREKGAEILITAADKDIAFDLLDEYGMEYIKLGSAGKGLIKKVLSVATLDYALFKAARDFKPDLLMGHTSIRCAHVARWLKAKSMIFTDTEATIKEHMLYAPFADWIVSPDSFERKFGDKHVLYPGYHELAYLHPNRFTPDPDILKSLRIGKREKFFILRFISWDATHDIGHQGLSYNGKVKLINMLKEQGRVLISSEEKLPMEFEKYRFSCNAKDMHDILAFSQFCISEGATMCSEAAMLGRPSVLISTLVHGYIKNLRDKHELISTFEDEDDAFKLIDDWLLDPDLHEAWSQKRDQMLQERIDVTQWMVDFVEEKFDLKEPTTRKSLSHT